jgi:hypothetical protein
MPTVTLNTRKRYAPPQGSEGGIPLGGHYEDSSWLSSMISKNSSPTSPYSRACLPHIKGGGLTSLHRRQLLFLLHHRSLDMDMQRVSATNMVPPYPQARTYPGLLGTLHLERETKPEMLHRLRTAIPLAKSVDTTRLPSEACPPVCRP